MFLNKLDHIAEQHVAQAAFSAIDFGADLGTDAPVLRQSFGIKFGKHHHHAAFFGSHIGAGGDFFHFAIVAGFGLGRQHILNGQFFFFLVFAGLRASAPCGVLQLPIPNAIGHDRP